MQRTIDERCEEIRDHLEHIRAACECAAEAARNAAGGAPEACAQLRGKVDRMCDVRREKLAQMDALKALARITSSRAKTPKTRRARKSLISRAISRRRRNII